MHSWSCGIVPKSGIPSGITVVGSSMDIRIVWRLQGPHPASCSRGPLHCRGLLSLPTSAMLRNLSFFHFVVLYMHGGFIGLFL